MVLVMHTLQLLNVADGESHFYYMRSTSLFTVLLMDVCLMCMYCAAVNDMLVLWLSRVVLLV